ncbi:MAG: Molybdenum ABC transporter, periplasmic molybdenum-binding protein ModA [uncultured Solirubrobacterales bacterium]|uniref:Molybdenum ABC transporter, periplasmic molybdenum-binding protein ModA n=1 Tax=uncultured Solirubrobacterales bacterium TaxID=768556 RepID=A0A6J4SKD6_9ACTN|nr:MAG: Molybdenum ABC transporter, periplasmic molybdenum-binding protein ModA [uncultured Solirubrobacterales bacterium]
MVGPLLAGCGGGAQSSNEAKPRLVVSAAASLTEALTSCSQQFDRADVRLSFAGSDELAAQIRQGVEPDVYAAANTKLPEALNKEGLVRQPRVFTTNELVLAVPADSQIRSVDALTRPGPKVVVGSESVPIGSYTREVLSRLGEGRARAVLANVRSNEPDVKGVIGKLTQGAADAGFVYASDVDATNGRLRAVELPERLQPTVAYGGAVVDGAPQPEAARAYVEDLTSGRCARALEQAGFGPPPG